jgi:spore maturation protein CgeB
VSFIGNYSAHKHALLDALVEGLGGAARLAVIGNGWKTAAAGTPLSPWVLGHALIGDYYAEAIGRSKINIALHHGPVGAAGWEDAVSTRTFEIPACGGFMLHVDNDEVREFYEPGTEIATFVDGGDLVAKVSEHLADATRRRTMAKAGCLRAVPAYSYGVRARALSQILQRMGGP